MKSAQTARDGLKRRGTLMSKRSTGAGVWVLLAVAGLNLPGCVVAAVGAGAGGGIYLTSRGAESLVEGSIERVAARTEAVFRDMLITPTGNSTRNSGDKREFQGTKGELDVRVKLERKTPGTTTVEVTARRNLAEWDKDYAKQVLAKIAAGG